MIKSIVCTITLNGQENLVEKSSKFKRAFPKFNLRTYKLKLPNNDQIKSNRDLDRFKIIFGIDENGNTLTISDAAIIFALKKPQNFNNNKLALLLDSFACSYEQATKLVKAKILFTGVQAIDEKEISTDATEYIKKHLAINTKTDNYYDIQMRFTYLINKSIYCNMQIGNLRKNDNKIIISVMDTNDRYAYNKNKNRSATIDDVKNVVYYSKHILFNDLDNFREGKGINVK